MWYWIFKPGFVLFFKIFFRLRVEGLENIPQKVNFIVACNHASFLDPLIIGVALPRHIHWIVLRDVFYTKIIWARWFMRVMKAMPQGGSSERAIKMLCLNYNVGLFPEGSRTIDGKLKDFKRGAALLAMKTGRPILPCAIEGAFEAYPRGAKFPKFRPIKVKIGQPVYLLKEFSEVVDDIYLQEGISKVKNSIEEMLNNG